MKKYLLVLIIGFLMGVISCNNNNSPRPVAEKFIAAFQRHNFKEASKYGTKETAKMLKQLQRIEEFEKVKPEIKAVKFIVVSEEIAVNKAIVYFKEDGSDTEEKIRLEKVNMNIDSKEKEWRVALSKTDVKIPRPTSHPALPDSLKGTNF